MAENIKVVIAKDGSTTVSVNGVAGKSCTDLTKNLERALGKQASQTKTAEYTKPARAGRRATA